MSDKYAPRWGTFVHELPTPVRFTSPALDRILGTKFNVLNDGFVRPVDYMGSDASIVRAARVSYGAGTKTIHEDRGLIRYLMRHRHTTPFEMCEIGLHVRVPMDHWRQWIRHRTANVNEYSTRYSEAISSIEKTKPDQWRLQSKTNKQGSDEATVEWPNEDRRAGRTASPGEYLTQREAEFHLLSEELYQERLEFGVAREQARKDLPLSQYTEAYWKMDLHNLFHFLSLRMDSHAQLEIRSYANIIAWIVKLWVPDAWSAFEDYRLNALHLTGPELEIIEAETQSINLGLKVAEGFGWLEQKQSGELKTNRERQEFEAKAKRIGFKLPWVPNG